MSVDCDSCGDFDICGGTELELCPYKKHPNDTERLDWMLELCIDNNEQILPPWLPESREEIDKRMDDK